jgi:Ulp1 protease family, C-terminal catalytic domain
MNAKSRKQKRFGKTRRSKKNVNGKNVKYYNPGPYQCRPRVGQERPATGCIPNSYLRKIAGKLGGGSSDGMNIRAHLEKKLGVPADAESTFVDALPIDDKEKSRLKQEYLRPKQPDSWKSDPDMWLDSTNIESVMKQYEEDYPTFKFLGPFPIDFAAPDPYSGAKDKCLIGEICDLNLKESAAAGKLQVGIIYNTDPHNKSGSHWIANYVDIPKHRCYYFDSYGYEAPKQIQKFMQWLVLQDPQMKLAYNARRFQFKGSECGMYSMYFISRMLFGEDFRHFCRRAPPDGEMLRLRKWMFST